jgi:hypothetical protein
MLTHCPECNQELSTAATQCPHCGAPVKQGSLAGTPVSKPVYVTPPPQGRCFRNCLIAGCILVVLIAAGVVVTGVVVARAIKNSFTMDPVQIAAIGQSVAPGATAPPGYESKAAMDVNIFGAIKAKGAFLMKGDPNRGGMVIGYGAFSKKGEKQDVGQKFQQVLENMNNQGGPQGQNQVEKQEEVDLDVAGEPRKALHMISVNQNTNQKQEMYILVLDNWSNDFGWLGVGAVGPEGKFDLDGFGAFLASLKAK